MKDYILVKLFPGMEYQIGTIFKFDKKRHIYTITYENRTRLSTEWLPSYFESCGGEFFIEYNEDSFTDKLIKKVATGQKILDEIANYSDAYLRGLIYGMLIDEDESLRNTARKSKIKRIIEDGQTKEIIFLDYDSIVISWSGIEIKFENNSSKQIYTFNKYFKI